MSKPIWEVSQNFCASTAEGRAAFLNGRDLESNPYGESLAGKNWAAGFKSEEAKAKA
jgi:hypothetical protein